MDGSGAPMPGTSWCLLQKSRLAHGECPSRVRLLHAPVRHTCPVHGAGPLAGQWLLLPSKWSWQAPQPRGHCQEARESPGRV